LRKRLPTAEVTVYNPDYRRTITYQGFWLDQVLGLFNRPGDELVFKCADGYTTVLPRPGVGVKKWLLAYGEKGGTWTPLVHDGKTLSPGPWYVVGTSSDSFKEFPWPYQVVTLEMTHSW
jgi:hypothetical protein